MDNQPNPKPFNPSSPVSNSQPNVPQSATTNPYATEIPTESIEHTPEQPLPSDDLPSSREPEPRTIATNPLPTPSNPILPPSAEDVREKNLPHKPHHFITKNALILGILFLITAALSSIITFALVNARSQKATPALQAPVSKITPTPDPMANWQPYTDIMGTYSVKYPLDFQVYNPTNTTTIIGTIDQITLYKQQELTPDFASRASIMTIEVLPSKIYTPPASAVVEPAMLAGKEFSKVTMRDVSGINSVEYVYSDTEHFYKLSYIMGENDSNFEKVIQSFAFTPADSTSVTPSTDNGIACTMDAKVCPDGSSVGRVPPSCEFAACP